MHGPWVGAGIAMAGLFMSVAWMYAARLRSRSDQRRTHLEHERKFEKMKIDGLQSCLKDCNTKKSIEEQKAKFLT